MSIDTLHVIQLSLRYFEKIDARISVSRWVKVAEINQPCMCHYTSTTLCWPVIKEKYTEEFGCDVKKRNISRGVNSFGGYCKKKDNMN